MCLVKSLSFAELLVHIEIQYAQTVYKLANCNRTIMHSANSWQKSCKLCFFLWAVEIATSFWLQTMFLELMMVSKQWTRMMCGILSPIQTP